MQLAIYGGTFDPVHGAHLTVAEEAVRAAHLDRVLLIPAADPPHKPGQAHAPYEDRLRMVELACAGHPHLMASDLERRQGRSYSIDTILQVRATLLNPSDQLYFLIGADAFAEIETWYRWRDVVQLVTFLVVSRPGYSYRVPDGANVQRLDTLALSISSSEIRAALRRGESPADLPSAVAEYIRSRHLYAAASQPHYAIL